MITQQSSPTFLFLCIVTLLLCSLIAANWGKNLPARGSWLIWTGIITLLAGVGFDSGLFLKNEFDTKVWMSGWILSKTELAEINVGLLQDPLGLAMVTLLALVAAIFLLNYSSHSKDSQVERILGGLGISMAGVALSWISLTPWIAFVGLTLALGGGFSSIAARWNSAPESGIAARFILERSLGFLLAFFGACVLATSRPNLLLNMPEIWASQTDSLGSTWMGSLLLVVGLFIQMQPFPFLGWLVSKSEGYHPVRLLLGQIFPAWAAFPLLLRLEPQFRSLGIFPAFGWVALISSVLTVSMGLFQRDRPLMIGIWLSAGFSISVAVLAFSGSLPAMALLLSVSLCAMALAGSVAVLDADTSTSSSAVPVNQAIWVKASVFLGVASGTGMVGFVSATGAIRWISQVIDRPVLAAVFLFSFLLFVLLGWKMAWSLSSYRQACRASWVSVLSSFLFIFLALGGVWTGTVTGDVIQGSPDRFMASLFDRFFGNRSFELTSSNGFVSAYSLYWGGLLFTFVASYWASGRKEDRWSSLATFLPKTSAFISTGYGVDFATQRVMDAVEWFGKSAENLVDHRFWAVGLPRILFLSVKFTSETVSRVDLSISSGLINGLKKIVEIPAKILQLIQTGDLRWYLFFALGSGFALLAHYLKM
jgi:hypothetical protein